jgi:hypothetical protein
MDQSERTGVFFLIVGTGHCGTKWLARALNHPRMGIECFHEEKLNWVTLDYQGCLNYEATHGVGDLYCNYFAFIRQELRGYFAVGDSHSWEIRSVPEVHARQPVDRLILLVRNGIQTVNSLYTWAAGISEDDPLNTDWLRWYWEIMGQPGGDWSSYSAWARWCLRWRANQATAHWLEERLRGQTLLRVIRLEDMVGDVEALIDLIQWLHPGAAPARSDLQSLQSVDINRKMQGDRSPQAIWATWTAEQREVFAEICGPAMEAYGYEWPLDAVGLSSPVKRAISRPLAAPQGHPQLEVSAFYQADSGAELVKPDHATQSFLFRALIKQLPVLATCADLIQKAVDAVGHPGDLGLCQWAQLIAFMLEFAPDVAIDLGRGWGNSTTALMIAANLQASQRSCRVISICQSDEWQKTTSGRVAQIVSPHWFDLLEVYQTNILAFDFEKALGDAASVLVFWDTNRFDVAECVLGYLMPLIARRRHVVAVHDISDARYSSYARIYGKHRLWNMKDSMKGSLIVGDVWSSSEDVVPILDFVSRNSLSLFSADHSLRVGAIEDPDSSARVRRTLGDLFSAEAHWRWFSLNEVRPPYTFPPWQSEGLFAEPNCAQSDSSGQDDSSRVGSEEADSWALLCERLGCMLNQPAAIAPAELAAAAAALQAILGAPDVAQFVADHRAELPAATLPLLIVNLATAWADGNQLLSETLERLYGLLTA